MALSITLFIIGLVIAYFPFYRLKKDDPLPYTEAMIFGIIGCLFVATSAVFFADYIFYEFILNKI